jgi:hypothetical protein
MSAPGCDRGQALPLVVLVLAAALAVCGAVAHFGGMVATRDQVAHATDAAALAGALGGESAARAVAVANGAQLESFTQEGDRVTVRVRGRGFVAEARAERVVELVDDSSSAPVGDSAGDNATANGR